MAGEDLVRIVPILTGADLAPMVTFWRRFGLEVTAEFDGYVIMATDPTADAAVEVHLAHWHAHDPRTAGAVYLRVRDATASYERSTWIAIVASSLAFGLLHERWLAGTLAGMLYAHAAIRGGQLSSAVVSHATTNLLITVYVGVTGQWDQWA